MRILWHSNAPWIRTGYGTQTAIWIPQLAALGHEVTVSGPFSFAGSPMRWGDFQVLPGAQDPFGSDVVADHYRRSGADLLITLCDVFMMDTASLRGLNVVHWLPVDCSPMGKGDREKAQGSMMQLAMTRFGQLMMQEAGFSPEFVPHGVDTAMFSPPEDRDALREQLGFEVNDFLIGINAANKNGPRKALMEQVIAFAALHERHPEAKLLIHSFAEPREGLNIKDLANRFGCTNAIMTPDTYAYACGMMDTPIMANWYKILDAFSNCAYGEGFGIPMIEAQACGVPVIATNTPSVSENVASGWLADCEPFWVGGQDAVWGRPLIHDIDRAYEQAWQAREDGKLDGYRESARSAALKFDIETVLEDYWVPVLDKIEKMRPKTYVMTRPEREALPEPGFSEGMRDMLVIVPSRGRPANVRRLIKAVAETAQMSTDLIFGFDEDDPDFEENISAMTSLPVAMKDRVRYKTAPRMSLSAWTNALAVGAAEKYKVLCSMGDDHEPQTPGWDYEIVKTLTAEGPGFTYPDDKVRSDIPQIVAVSSEIVRELGWMCLPELEHYFVDNVWNDLGQRSGYLTFLPDVTVEHIHHLRYPGEVKRDKTYRDAESKFRHDYQAYEVWKATRMEDDVAVIRKLREAAGR